MDRAQAELDALKRTEEDLKKGHQKLEEMVSRLDQEVVRVSPLLQLYFCPLLFSVTFFHDHKPDVVVIFVFPLDWGRQKYRAAEEKGRGAEWSLGEDGEPIREQWHWRRHCAYSAAVQTDPEPLCWRKRNRGHHLLPGRGPAQGRHRPGGFPQGEHVNTAASNAQYNVHTACELSPPPVSTQDVFRHRFQ